MVMKNKDSQEYLQSQRKVGKTFTFDRYAYSALMCLSDELMLTCTVLSVYVHSVMMCHSVFGPNVDQARVFADVKSLVVGAVLMYIYATIDCCPPALQIRLGEVYSCSSVMSFA